jgi:alcohol dehydrogenase class IV
MAANIEALIKRHGAEHPAFVRYKEVAAILTGDPHARAEDGVTWVLALCRDLNVPPLAAYGITAADLPRLVENASKASSTKANPIVLKEDELTRLLEAAL